MKRPAFRIKNTVTALLCADCCGVLAACLLAWCLRRLTGGSLSAFAYLDLLLGLSLFPFLYASLGLYPDVFRQPSNELKRLCLGTSLGFLSLSLLIFLGKQGDAYSRSVLLISWLGALVLVPLFRYGARRLFADRPWWGYPVVLFALRAECAGLEEQFRLHRRKGLYIAAVQALDPEGYPGPLPFAPDLEGAERVLRSLAGRHPGAMALIVADSLSRQEQQALIMLAGRHFKRVHISLNTFWLKQFSLRVADLPCGPALSLRQNLLDPVRMRIKRGLDLFLCALGAGVLLVAVPLIALCIRLDSKGPVFFTQTRVGRHGRPIKVLKFRTMVVNAGEVLQRILEQDPALRKEWQETQKLARDPRLTRMGAWLRRTSLDELPQVFNVIKGEMSLVGPRPIVEGEIQRYGETYEMYASVLPGITGLWQISGRSDVDYARRVELDRQYVYNWSVWLDIYIIVRTIPVLLSGKGAY